MRSTALILAALIVAPLGACSKPAQKQDTAPAAAPNAKPGIAVTEARLVLPAVKGNPGAAYFTVANTGSGTAAIAAVSIDGAGKAEMHQTQGSSMAKIDRVDIAPSTELAFAPGSFHVMVFGVKPTLAAGGETPMTLTFVDGDKITTPLKIAAAGADDAMAGMAGMDHR